MSAAKVAKAVKEVIFSANLVFLSFIFAISIKGDWVFLAAGLYKQFYRDVADSRHLLNNFHYFFIGSTAVSLGFFFIIGGYLQWAYYIKRRDQAEQWKLQPDRFLSAADELHEIMLGSSCVCVGSVLSALLACYVVNGGQYSQLYFSPLEKGWLWLVVSLPVTFLYLDAIAYYLHRTFHRPFLYRHFHKWHHRYLAPTAFAASAIHPVEFVIFQMCLASAIFVLPVHFGVYVLCLLYQYYYGLMDHSGINFTHIWPWQPDARVHDRHHQYFHCNYGFNTHLFDWLHGTTHNEQRIYSEDEFSGHGMTPEEFHLQKHKIKKAQ